MFASKFEPLDETDEFLIKYKLTSSRRSRKSEYHLSLKGNSVKSSNKENTRPSQLFRWVLPNFQTKGLF